MLEKHHIGMKTNQWLECFAWMSANQAMKQMAEEVLDMLLR